MKSVLFVCLGNICRSPAAEEILRNLIRESSLNLEIMTESCGLGSWHEGKLPDARMREFALKRGFVLSSRAQVFRLEFLDQFDYVLAADRKILEQLFSYAQNTEQKEKLHLITAFSKEYCNQEVPDPYYRGDAGFEQVLDMLQDSCKGILEHMIKKN